MEEDRVQAFDTKAVGRKLQAQSVLLNEHARIVGNFRGCNPRRHCGCGFASLTGEYTRIRIGPALFHVNQHRFLSLGACCIEAGPYIKHVHSPVRARNLLECGECGCKLGFSATAGGEEINVSLPLAFHGSCSDIPQARRSVPAVPVGEPPDIHDQQ